MLKEGASDIFFGTGLLDWSGLPKAGIRRRAIDNGQNHELTHTDNHMSCILHHVRMRTKHSKRTTGRSHTRHFYRWGYICP